MTGEIRHYVSAPVIDRRYSERVENLRENTGGSHGPQFFPTSVPGRRLELTRRGGPARIGPARASAVTWAVRQPTDGWISGGDCSLFKAPAANGVAAAGRKCEAPGLRWD